MLSHVNRVHTIKHHKSEAKRATKPGVVHKYVSAESLELAVHRGKTSV